MPRSYRRIKGYEEEILEMKSQGVTSRATGERLQLKTKQTSLELRSQVVA